MSPPPPVNFECWATQIDDLQAASEDASGSWFVVGEVAGVHVDESLLVDGIYNTAAALPELRGGGPSAFYGIDPAQRFAMVRPNCGQPSPGLLREARRTLGGGSGPYTTRQATGAASRGGCYGAAVVDSTALPAHRAFAAALDWRRELAGLPTCCRLSAMRPEPSSLQHDAPKRRPVHSSESSDPS